MRYGLTGQLAVLVVGLLWGTGLVGQRAVGPQKWLGDRSLSADVAVGDLAEALLQRAGRLVMPGKIPLHQSMPLDLEVALGKRAGEFVIAGLGKSGKRLLAPVAWRLPIRYGRRGRSHHFFASAHHEGLVLHSLSMVVLRRHRHVIGFLDLDHDGAFGGVGDGWVLSLPRQRGWQVQGGVPQLFGSDEALAVEGGEVYFLVEPSGLAVTVASAAPDRSVDRAIDLAQAVADLNAARHALGFTAVTVEIELSEACEQHARYCLAHKLLSHEEHLGLREYSERGHAAGINSVLCRAPSATDALRVWLGSFYHRIEMLSPRLSAIGIGFADGYAVMDVLTRVGKPRRFEPYAWPVDGARDVPLTWPSGENPSPIGSRFDLGIATGYGYPVTLTMPTSAVRSVDVRLLRDGTEEVPVFVSSPDLPGNPEAEQKNSILVMSRKPLQPATRYVVSIRCSYENRSFRRVWGFRTR